jgi:predicted O-linked N-acetylglucosamine transferase (SPINDLY family)
VLTRFFSTLFSRKPDVAALNARALEHYGRGEVELAEQYFRDVARASPSDLSAWTNLAVALVRQRKHKAALPILVKVIEMQPDLAEAHYDLALCYSRLRRTAEGIPHYERAIALNPDLHQAHAALANAYLDCCDWAAVDRWRADFLAYKATHPVRLWAQRIEPFTALLLFPGTLCKQVSRERSAELVRSIAGHAPLERSARREGQRLRVGYVSAELYNHPMAHLTWGLFEAHDRTAFETFVYSSGPDDGSEYRKHIAATAEHFIDIRNETPEASARRIATDRIDVLVDLTGYTAGSRTQIFAYRPAPVQASYIGFPGSMGADFIDYFISDRIATPAGLEGEFSEKIVRLPGTYLVTDDRQPIGTSAQSRSDAGLPEDGFVYCSFNRLSKVDREIFEVWMDILRAVPRSVLWLVADEPEAERNLREHARALGIEENRLVFAPRVPKPEHLARHRLADLFLDTTLYNAHTGTVDALWTGLPVLTWPAQTFSRRVAASLLHAVGLPELAVRDLAEYQDTAIAFAKEPERLKAIRDKLLRNRTACALFDTAAHARNLEAAYARMHRLHAAGKRPANVDLS